VDRVVQELDPTEVGALLHQFLGFPEGHLSSKEAARSALVDTYDALSGNTLQEGRPSVLTITDHASPDGRIQGHAHVLPAGTRRVYAVFENDFGLRELDHVLAVWRNPSDDRMVFAAVEPIRQGSAYNYVWVEAKEGLPPGYYQVELFHPEAQTLLLGSETFSVR
jgi:hypothetical protein